MDIQLILPVVKVELQKRHKRHKSPGRVVHAPDVFQRAQAHYPYPPEYQPMPGDMLQGLGDPLLFGQRVLGRSAHSDHLVIVLEPKIGWVVGGLDKSYSEITGLLITSNAWVRPGRGSPLYGYRKQINDICRKTRAPKWALE